jgi:hypothetical protein
LTKIKTNSLVEILSQRVDINPMFNKREDAINEVKLGTTKGTTILRKWKSVQDPMRIIQLREI